MIIVLLRGSSKVDVSRKNKMDGRPWISKINTDGHLTIINSNKNNTEIERIGIPRSSKSDIVKRRSGCCAVVETKDILKQN